LRWRCPPRRTAAAARARDPAARRTGVAAVQPAGRQDRPLVRTAQLRRAAGDRAGRARHGGGIVTQSNLSEANVSAVPTQPVGTAKTGNLAVVNLLPPEIHEAAKFRRLQFALAGVGVAAVAVVG